MKEFLEILKVIFLGIIEGVTEWLPVSSTGHMILVDEFIKLNTTEAFKEMFLVVIQLGAILAVPIVFWKKLYPFSTKNTKEENKRILSLWAKVIVGIIPVGIIGVFLDDFIDEHLFNPWVVATALVVYGIAFILLEKFKKNSDSRVKSVYDLTYKDALCIGSFQILSLLPGTSRSGSTMLGGMLTGVSRESSAEFSFFMAIPVMLGASFLKIVKFFMDGGVISSFEIVILLVGMAVAFLVSLVIIDFLMSFVKKHTLSAFGVYRIILGALVIGYFIVK